jgi:hypothetical protein
VVDDYRRSLFALLRLGPGAEPGPQPLHLSSEARERWLGFVRWLEPQLGPKGDLDPIRDWAGKLPGAVLRIAGLLHCGEYATIPAPWNIDLTAATMDGAIDVGRYLLAHAQAAFAEQGAGPRASASRMDHRDRERVVLRARSVRDLHVLELPTPGASRRRRLRGVLPREGLNRGLFVDADNVRARRPLEIEVADDPHLLAKQGIRAVQPELHSVRSQALAPQDSPNLADAEDDAGLALERFAERVERPHVAERAWIFLPGRFSSGRWQASFTTSIASRR